MAEEARGLIPEEMPPEAAAAAAAATRRWRSWRGGVAAASLAGCALVALAHATSRGHARTDDRQTESKYLMDKLRGLSQPVTAAESEWVMMGNGTEADVHEWSSFRQAFWPGTDAISFKTYNGRYLTAMPDGVLCAELLKPSIWTEFKVKYLGGNTLSLRTGYGKYMTAHADGSVTADADTVSSRQTFEKVNLGDGRAAFKTFQGKYLIIKVSDGYRMTVTASAPEVGDWESFSMVHIPGTSTVAFKSYTGKYLAAKEDGFVDLEDADIEPRDGFAMIENDDGTVSLRTQHNTYLSAEKDGGCAAKATHIGLMERFKLISNSDETVAFKGCHDKYVSVQWAPHWLRPEQSFLWDQGIVTYAGETALEYIDGAAMLGHSLDEHMPGYPRVCLVGKGMTSENRRILKKAGWELLEVDMWHASQNSSSKVFNGINDRFWDTFPKIDVFRVNMERILWMDADMYVYSKSLKNVFDTTLAEGEIGMVMDCCGEGKWGKYNSGLMLLRPSMEVYKDLREKMTESEDYDALDQKVINTYFDGKIVDIPAKFNAHKYHKDQHGCDDVVVGHFTGPWKPSAANRTLLHECRIGKAPRYGLDCDDRYRDYYCRLRKYAEHLSDELQEAIERTGGCIEGPARTDVPMEGFR